jgi:hypothetical protein
LPYLSQEPLLGNAVKSGICYTTKSSGHDTLTASVFMDCRGQDGLRIDYAGCRPNLKLAKCETGSIPELSFDLDMVKWQTTHTGTNLTTLVLTPAVDTDTEPIICLGAEIILGNERETIHTQKLEFNLGAKVGRRKSMIPASGFRSSRYTERQVTGKFDLDLDDDAQFTAWIAQETSTLLARFGDEAGNIIVVIFPYVRRTGVDPADSDGIRTQDIAFEAARTTTIEPIYIGYF